ncbi:nuclear transport factor 2 family protein [Variovorax arabinosiphilus]|uniref:nuclear transport factor 2 family protein n=1 Tax=Variovorax arabinosiphilus TaxID=3053498 RepID=UPI00257654E6|nr:MULTISPECIES: nuclear transport factor 2 family protein [unclassified Variovorax]MDM0118729.1 nuclear transport factor 2 family protein [Variovorax sp. J2L1-78]MDM0129154.1 nuclear transport factor 2 family protein [Variovorax sp. J2L1-63]MDM0233059.1 nuclear transport factor 2 family protein [Variovorax sp. J2R1-6]
MTAARAAGDAIEAQLVAMEARRCNAMIAADIESLKEILHPDLIHVHAKGQIDGYASYFATGGFKVDYKTLDRSELQVRVLGDSALMTGRQLLVAVRKDGSGTVRIDSRVMQTWVREAGRWRQLAFQTTPLDMSIG